MSTPAAEQLDLETALRVSEEISSETVLERGVVRYLIKPFAADELLACVRRAVRRHDVGDE